MLGQGQVCISDKHAVSWAPGVPEAGAKVDGLYGMWSFNWSPRQAALLGSCVTGRIHRPVTVQGPRNTLHNASSLPQEDLSSQAAKTAPPTVSTSLINENPKGQYGGIAATVERKSPRSPITSCQQAAELDETGYSQAPSRPSASQVPLSALAGPPQEPTHR